MASGATTVVDYTWIEDQMKTKLRAGVDKGRPITSVADSVKKFGGSGATEVKRTPVPPKPKQSSPAHVKPDDKHTTAKKPSVPFHSKPSPPSKPRTTVHHDKPDAHPSKHSHAHHPHSSAKDHTHHPHPHPHHTPHTHHPHPHKPEPANRSAKVTHKKPHPHHHAHSHATTSDKKESEKQEKKMEEEKKTEEVTITKEEPKPEPEPVAPPADAEPPSEPKPEALAAEVKPSEKKEEETTIQQLEKDTTRAQRVISLFENKGTSKPEQEQAPAWKVNAQQQRTAKDKEEREKETARQKEQEQEEKEKQEAEEKSRTSSNASSHKDEPVIVNGSVETTTAESANDEKEVRTPETDGGIITKPKTVASASSNVTKSTSALPPATKNTSNKNEEIKIRDNKMKKTGSASTIIPDPKKRLMVEEKGKRTSWAAPKREECAVCGKVVYVMERLEADKVVYHKTCFKCTVCNKTLSTGTYAALQGKTYCKVHFKQLFKMKGNYDEGFGREQHKTKWIKKDGETEA